MRTSISGGWISACRFGSIMFISASLSAACFAQRDALIASGQHAKFSSPNAATFEDLKRDTELGAGSRIRTASNGRADLAWGNGASLRLLASGDLAIGDVRGATAFSSAPTFSPADAAIKSVLTKNDATVLGARIQPANATLTLSAGSLVGSVEQANLNVSFGKGEMIVRRASFAISTQPNDCARLTVDSGEVTVVPTGGRPLSVYAGQFVKLCTSGSTIAVTGPMPAESDSAARTDLVAMRTAGGLAPIAAGTYSDGKTALDGKAPLPVGEGPKNMDPPGNIGIAPSIPFDLRGVPVPPGTTRLPLLQPANPPNVNPPVNSPEQP